MQKINSEKFYTPKEIAEMNIITGAAKPEDRRQMLLRFIRQKKITALNLGGAKKPRYVVQGKHLTEYMNAQMKPGDYETK